MTGTRIWLVTVALLVGSGVAGAVAPVSVSSGPVVQAIREMEGLLQGLSPDTTAPPPDRPDLSARLWVAAQRVVRLPRALPVVRGVVGDKRWDWRVRGTLILGLQLAHDDQAVLVLSQVLQDKGEREGVRYNAATALGEIGGETARQVLTDVLRDTMVPVEVRNAAIGCLAAIGCDDVVLMLKAIREPWVDWVPLRAVDALGRSRNPTATSALLELGKETQTQGLRGVLIPALGRRKAREAVPWLLEVLEADSVPGHRKLAATALGQIGDRRAVAALIQTLDDQVDFVVSDAAEALGRLRALEAAPALKKLLDGIYDDPRFQSRVNKETRREQEYDLAIPKIRKAYHEVSR